MFIKFINRHGRNIMVNVKDITLVIQKGVFCELYIRGVEGHVVVNHGFNEINNKIKEKLSQKYNAGCNVSEENGHAS